MSFLDFFPVLSRRGSVGSSSSSSSSYLSPHDLERGPGPEYEDEKKDSKEDGATLGMGMSLLAPYTPPPSPPTQSVDLKREKEDPKTKNETSASDRKSVV